MTLAMKKPEYDLTTTVDETAAQNTPKSVRETLGLSRQEMAELIGMSDFGYIQWEEGKRSPGKPAWRLLYLMETRGQSTLDGLRDYPA